MKSPESIILFLKGLLMGMADIIPGVSGGTMALITGIYERLIHAIKNIDFKFIIHFFKGDMRAAKENIQKIDWPFLIPLGIGILTALLIFARVIQFFLDNHTAPTYSFFFGLILASLGVVSKYVDRIDLKHLISGLIGFIIVFLIIGIEELEGNHTILVIFLSGMIAICAMILPGISGSLILLILGQYYYMTDALNNLKMKDLIAFAVGALIGIVAFSRLLDYMIKHHRSTTMAFLFGLMVGALRAPAEKIGGDTDLNVMSDILIIIIAGVIGFIMVALIEWKSKEIERKLGVEVDH